MSGNSIGKLFTVTTFGESHGPAIGCIVDGCPPGMPLSVEDIQPDLDRRRPGRSHYTTQRREADHVEILSGVYQGVTTGTPIALLIANTDQKSKDYQTIADQFRPGHADYSYWVKYGIRDPNGGGRASARGTATWVAAGAIAKKYLQQHYGMQFRACLQQMGEIHLNCVDWQQVNDNDFFTADPKRIPELEAYLTEIRKAGDSIGAKVRVEGLNILAGLGEPVFDRLDADIAHALMSINAVKGVEMGDGYACVEQRGSEHRDELTQEGFLSNHAGGILGGISTGQDLIATIALKPAASILIPGKSINERGEAVDVVTKGRHDPCVGIRAVPIAEAMLALVVMDHVMRHRGQNTN